MDTLTHLLVGHAMGAAASNIAEPWGAAAYWGALIGNSLPDIDVPVSLLLRRDIKLHRTITHTIPGVAGLSVVAAAVMQLILPGAPFTVLLLWTLLGCMTHLFMDCLNLFGAQPFWPLVRRPVGLGVLHIVDPVIMLLLGASSLGVATQVAAQGSLVLAFVLMWPYVFYRLAAAKSLHRRLRAEGSVRAHVIPWFSGWRYLRETQSTIEFGLWRKGRRQALNIYPKQDSPLIRASREHPKVSAFLKSAEYPYALIQKDGHGHAVVWADALRQLRADFRPLRVPVDSETA